MGEDRGIKTAPVFVLEQICYTVSIEKGVSMADDREGGTDRQALYNHWDEWSELQRNIIFFLFWLEMQKRSKLFWLALTTALAALIAWGISHDPFVLAVGLMVGLILGVVIFALR